MKEIKKRYSLVIEPEIIKAQKQMAEDLSEKRQELKNSGKLNIKDVEGHLEKVTASNIARQGINLLLEFHKNGMFEDQDFELVLKDTFYK